MVAIVSGSGLGILNGSASTLGAAGLFGNSAQGATKEAAYVNAATGNLVVSDRDAFLASVGVNLALTRTYNSMGNLSTGNGLNWKTGPVKTVTLTGAINAVGSTIVRTDADGSVQRYEYVDATKSYRSTDGDGAHDTLVRVGDEWLWEGDNRDLNGVYERYDASGRIVATGEHGTDRLKYGYNAAGQLASVTDANGDVTTYEYAGANLARIRTTQAGNVNSVRTYYEYDTLNRLKAVTVDMTPADGAITDGKIYRTTYDYWDTGTQLKQIKQSDRSELNFTYDAQGRVATVRDGVGQTTTFSYSDPGRTTITDAMGTRTTFAYDANQRLTSVSSYSPSGSLQTTSYFYDTDGNLARTVSPTGRTTVYGYDANGNRILERDADGRTITRVYDLATNLLKSETTYTVADPDGDGTGAATGALTRRYFYDADNQLRFTLSPDGRLTEYGYNAQHQLASQRQFHVMPDAAASASYATLAQWAATPVYAGYLTGLVEYTYDVRGQLDTATSYSTFLNGKGVDTGKTIQKYVYDATGRLLKTVDGDNNATVYGYDELGRLQTQLAADGTRKTIGYNDAVGTMSVSYYGKSATVYRTETFALDANGQVTSSISAHDATTSDAVTYRYDPAGRLRLRTDAAGNKTHILYDGAGRKVAEIVNRTMVEYVYNADGQLTGTIQYAADIDPALLTSATGDLLYPTLAALRPTTLAQANRVTYNNYDAAGRLLAAVDANGYLTRYTYDGLGRLVSTVRRAAAVNTAEIVNGVIPAAFTGEATVGVDRYERRFYDGDSHLIALVDGNGALTEYVYSAAGRLIDTTTRSVAVTVPVADSTTLATLITQAGAVATHRRNIYDGKGLLVGIVDEANYLTEITYDAAGNVSSRRTYATPVTKPSAIVLADVGSQVSADDRITTYTYNAANQVVTELTAGGDKITYGYDDAGRQVSVSRSSTTSAERTALKRYDGAGRVAAELSEEGVRRLAALGATPDALQVAQIWAAFGIRYTYDAAGNRTSMTDQLGNRTLYVWSEGRLAVTINPAGDWERYTYDAFGDLIEVARYTTALTTAQMNDIAAGVAAPPAGGAALYTKYYYDNEGRQVFAMDADGAVRKTEYNAFDQVQRTLQYRTPLMQVTAAISNRGHTSGTATDLATALAGSATSQVNWYDTAGNLIYAVDANNAVMRRQYDLRGNLTVDSRLGKLATGSLTGTLAERNTLAALVNASLDSTRTYGYDARGLLVDAADTLGYHTVSRYNAFGQADLVTRYATSGGTTASALDNVTQTLYDRNGRVRATLDGSGALTAFRYDADGRVIERITYAKALAPTAGMAQIQSAVETQSLADPVHDLRQRFVYDANGRLTATLTLQTGGKPTVAGDPASATGKWGVVANTYDNAGRLVQKTGFAASYPTSNLTPTDADIGLWISNAANAGPADSAVRYAYDADDRVVATATAQRGSGAQRAWAVEQIAYDGAGNISQRTSRYTLLLGAAPSAAEMLNVGPTTTGATGVDAVTFYSYDAMGRVIATATALNGTGAATRWAVTKRSYDTAGNLLSVREYATALTGSGPGDFATAVTANDAADRITRYSYDAGNRLVATVDPEGAAVGLKYDARGNVISSTRFAVPVTGVANLPPNYQPAASPGGNTPADRVTRTYYDLANRPLIEIDPSGAVVQRRYDVAGRVLETVEYAPLLTATEIGTLTTAASVTALMTQKAALADPATRVTTYGYDAGGNLVSTTDALKQTESYTYDALGHKLTFKNKLGNIWNYEYDAAGHMVRETAPPVTTFTNALLGTLADYKTGVQQTFVTAFEYDALNNLVRRTEAAGISGMERVTEYRYDAQGRQVQIVLPDVQVYDPTKEDYAVNGEHTVHEVTSGVRTVTVTYDTFGNAVSNTDVGGKVSYKIYDRSGNVRWEVDAAGYATGYERDVFGQVTAMTRYGNVVKAGVAGAAADNFATLLNRDDGKDRTIRYTYDAAGRQLTTAEPVVATYDPHASGTSAYIMAGRTTVNEYNTFGEVYRRSVYGADAKGVQLTEAAVTRYYYDVRGQKTAQIDALSDVAGRRSGYLTKFAYDTAGNLKEQIEYATAFGTWTDTTYSSFTTSAQDRTTRYEYDNLSRKTAEKHIGVTYADSTSAANVVSGDVTTRYQYDAVGNQTVVTDATGAQTFTYYDQLGRVQATARRQTTAAAGIQDAGIKVTEYKLDIHGDVVLRVDYATASTAADATSYTVTDAMKADAATRVTATRYDNWGHALESLDAEQFATLRHSTRFSYDVYGRVAKQWRTVTDVNGNVKTSFQVLGYDALGHATSVSTPGLIDLVDQTVGATVVRLTEYNAFGEVTRAYVNGVPGTDYTTSYDQAGHAWRTNVNGGVETVRLYDVQGNATAVITSTGTTPGALTAPFNATSGAYDAAALQANDQVLRTENRYDLLGHLVETRVQPDSRLTVLVREAEAWVRKTVPGGQNVGDSLVVMNDDSADGPISGVRYRLAGGAWVSAAPPVLRVIDGTTVLDTAALPVGDYEYEVTLQPPAGPAFTRTGGRLHVARVGDPGKARQIVEMYLMLFNRAADRPGVNFWLDAANKGSGVPAIFAAMLADAEARTYMAGTPAEIIGRLFSNTFGTAAQPAGGTPEQIAHWVQRYTSAVKADGTTSTEQRGLVMADLLDAILRANGPAAQVFTARAAAIEKYVVTLHGSDRTFANSLMAKAATDAAGALALATQVGTLEYNRVQLIEMYVALFGRAPDLAGLTFWTNAMAQGTTIEQAAEQMLGSVEASQPWLYPSAGLTPQQYNEQLVNRAYSLALGRAPSTKELGDWLAKLSATPPLTRARFAVQFAAQVSSYAGTDATLVADRNLFTNKVSTAYTAVVTLNGSLPAGDAGSILLAGVTSTATAQEAAEKALLAAKVNAELARNAHNAADTAAGATPLEDIRRSLTRLYTVILGRVPDMAGMETFIPAKPYTAAQWKDVALSFLNSSEATAVLGNWRALDNRAFVEKLYRNALGVLPTGAAALKEIDGFVARLNAGATREQIAFDVADTMLSPQNLSPGDQALRTLLDNRTAVGLTAGLSLTLLDLQTQRTVMSLVTSTSAIEALNYAYAASQTAMTTKLTQLAGNATTAAQLADAMSKAALGNTSALAANATLQANPAAAYRLQLTQLYVALLGRSATNPPDVAGVQFYVDRSVPLDEVAQSFITNTEGVALYGGLSNAAFVDKVVAQLLGNAALIGADVRAGWTAQLAATPAPTRGKVALDIVNSVLTYVGSGNGASAGNAYLTARATLLQRVADAFAVLDTNTAAEVTRITNLRTSLKTTLDQLAAQLTPLQTTWTNADSARASAVSAATTALTNANASGDGTATRRLQILRMYATLLQRPTSNPPTLADLKFWLQSTPEVIAQQLIDSSEGRTYFPAGSTDATFITNLYTQILNRAPSQADLAFWGNYLAQNAGRANVRGSLAVQIIDNWANYSDNTPSQLTYKRTVDDRITSYITSITSAANTANTTASATLTEATRLANAVTTAQTNKTNAQTAVNNALPAYNDAQAMLSLSTRRKVAEVYAQLRNSADYAGALYWMRAIANGSGTSAMLVDNILASEYPADPADFVRQLFLKVLGRAATTADVNWYAGVVTSYGRAYVANDIMNSPEALGRLPSLANSVESSLTSKAYADIATKTNADTALANATSALNTAQTNYTNYGWTVASATAALNAATGAYNTMTALTNAFKLVITADDKYKTAADAKVAYDAKKAQYDKANADYQAALALPLAQYQAAAALGSTIRSAANAFASAAASLPAVATYTTPVNVRTQQLAQLYITLLNRAPTLTELYLATEKIGKGATLNDIAAGLMAANPALYPAGQTDSAFVGLLYTNGLSRTGDAAGIKYFTDQLATGISRAELATRFVSSIDASNNADTTTLNNRTRTILTQLGGTVIGAAQADAVADATMAQARQQAVAFDAAGAAALAASADAQRTVQLTRLYVALLNRIPDSAGLNFFANALRNNTGLTIETVAQQILTSPEGQRLLPSTLSNSDFVQAFFRQAMGRAATSAELTQYTNQLATQTRGQVAVAIINAVLNYQGSDREARTSQLGFAAQVSEALHQLATQSQQDDTNAQAAIALLDRTVKAGVPTLYLADTVTATKVDQGGTRTALGAFPITVDRWGNVLAMSDPRDPSFRITYQYNYNNQLVAQTQNAQVGKAAATAYTRYDALGRVAATIDFNNNKNAVGYDSLGNVVREYHADGGVVVSSYNLFGNRLSVQQPSTTLTTGQVLNGVLTRYTYDHLGNLRTTTTGGPVRVVVARNTGDNDFSMDTEYMASLVQRFEYDELGRQIRNIGADGVATVLEYDADGNVISSATQDRSTVTPGGLLYRVLTKYDAEGHKVATRNANNDRMTWIYDHGRLTSSTDMGGATTTYGYDLSGRLLSQVSTRGQKLTYGYTSDKLTYIDDAVSKISTRYTYDAAGNRLSERQSYYGPEGADAPPRLQNNTLRYDAQNRLAGIKDDMYDLSYEYDANGNRTKITSSYNGQAPVQFFNAYDAMNRQTVVNGDWDAATGKAVFGKYGHAITYDKAGNRLSDTSIGWAVTVQNGVYGVYGNTATTENYTYDAAGRLSTITHDGLRIDTRLYDLGGRITRSGLLSGADSITSNLLTKLGTTSAGRIYSYDTGGHITRQKDLKADGGTLQDTYFVSDPWNPSGGYDAMGNLTGYTVVLPNTQRSSNGRYIVDYYRYDTYKERTTTLATNNTVNYSKYDDNGNRIEVREGGTTGKLLNRLWYDADGHVQSHTASGTTEFNLIVNGQVYGEESGAQNLALGSNYLAATSPSLTAAPSSYSVQSTSETLQSIAQNIWGDAGLWYLIADANALSSDAKLTVGQILRIPTRVNTVHGDYRTYTPYDASEQVGSTAPTMPAPQSGGGGCGGLGQLVMVVVAVVATIYTAGAAAGMLGAGATAGAGAGAAAAGAAAGAAGATGFASTWAAGLAVMQGASGLTAASAIAAGAIGGAAGSIASQAVGIAIGAQDSFSWKGVALSAVGGGVSAGVASGLGSAKDIAGTIGRAALSNTIGQGVGIVTGLQNGFDWRGVAASAAGSAAGYRAAEALQGADMKDLFKQTASGMAAGATTAIARGGKFDIVRVATDAFGNALGNSVVDKLQESAATRQLINALDKTGTPYTLDENGLPVADPNFRASFNFVQGSAQGGATLEQILAAKAALANGLSRLDSAPGDLPEDVLRNRTANALAAQSSTVEGRNFSLFSTDSAEVRALSSYVDYVTGSSVGPKGASIIGDTIAGGVTLLAEFSDFYAEHELAATVTYKGVQAVLSGGPVKTVVLEVAKIGAEAVVADVTGAIANVAETQTRQYVTDYARKKGWEFEFTVLGQDVTVGPDQFGEAAGKLAGGVVDAILGKGVDAFANRGTAIANIVQPGQTGRYGDLAKLSKKDGLQVDHVPSHASNVLAEELRLKRALTVPERQKLKNDGWAVVVSDSQHTSKSRTYGGRNNSSIQYQDALDPTRAIRLDIANHADYLRSVGKSESEIRQIIRELTDKRNQLRVK
ncbi:YD repeat-containing protein [Massilia sp. PDC64]|nr:DUF4214 domain-containing protein [Massilia sp. PDC64]SDF64610.1 YD repeat-containing protein [Massilia sp. PDC64]